MHSQAAWLVLLTTFLGANECVAKDSKIVSDAKAAVTEMLIDDESARFKIDYEDRSIVCGRVNSKNKMGGYGGYDRFMFTRNKDPKEPGELWLVDPRAEEARGLTEAKARNMLAVAMCDELINPKKE